jgi:ABC-2 type transport system permease protein
MTGTTPTIGVRTTSADRLAALARAELTLLGRAKGTLFAAVIVPLVLPFSTRAGIKDVDLKEHGLSVGTVVLPAAIGFSLLFAVYTSLLTVFVARREELVLKRLRTGELRDVEILAGAALPAVAVSLAQCLLLAVGCTVLLHIPAPPAPQLAVLGLLLGIAVCVTLAAVTASFSRTTESAQVTGLPVLLLSLLASGLVVPLEVLPDGLASVCGYLPLSSVITLVRGGWTDALSAAETARAVVTALAWTVAGVFAVRRWFRWEPRR